ncbi:putative Ig domain-containing protein [Streptomyces sp. Isolate_45]|uniref:putative Ig domain-containing protein n=1 Tax=Streptomyces sp. Isolate_45 TaxID=2950111 RepID=UPI002481C4DD|nr:putative Ig domain-containing protein [Streptomyces sp. Isolate_45]MDA5280200.1 putative Ig domain-containing protein [Streptomyces sp. Isolate_45]
MRRLRNHHVLTGVVAATALMGLAALPAHAGSSPGPTSPDPAASVPAGVRAAMARDLGLSPEGVRGRIADEQAADRTATAVRATVGDRVAGIWFDAADGRLHAAVTTAADADAVRRAGAVAERVDHSADRLEAVTRQIGEWAGNAPGLMAWGPDARANRVGVVLDPTRATSALRTRLAAFEDLVDVTESTDTPRQQGGNIVGGEKWVPGGESPCSIGFPVTRTSGGTKAFLTAGHCTNDVNQAAYGKDGTRVGTSNKNGTGSVNAAEGDFGIVDVDQAGWEPTPTVSGWGKGDVTLTGTAEAVVGTAVCRSGQTTGFQCGEVTKTNQSVDYGNVVINGLSYSNACSAGGDSGGSYVTASGGKAVGLHSGGGSATCSGGSGEKFTIFQPVNEALAKFGAGLTTSTPQPGEVTVAAVSAKSHPTGSPVELKNSAEGGTAPYTWSATGLPAGLSIASTTGTVSGTPTAAGTHSVTVTATDSAGKKGSASFTWTITTTGSGNPTLTGPGNQNLYVGRPVNLPLTVTGGSAPYTFTATNLPTGLTINAATGVISGTPTGWGFRNVTLTVTDAAGGKSTVTATFTVWS